MMTAESTQRRWTLWLLLLVPVGIAAFSAVFAVIMIFFANHIGGSTPNPEVVLPMLLIGGVVALLISIGALFIVYRAWGTGGRERPHALGLPRGSVRAIIALMLILIFAIVVLFMYATLAAGNTSTLRAQSQTQVANLIHQSGVTILSITPNDQDTTLSDVRITVPVSPGAQDFAKQVLTTLSTLVVALSAFYFGSQSTGRAGGGMARPQITTLSPNQGSTAGDEEVVISGAGFTTDASVKFGSADAAGTSFISDTQLSVKTPSHEAGSVDVTVTTPAGTSLTSDATKFTYV